VPTFYCGKQAVSGQLSAVSLAMSAIRICMRQKLTADR
jgi:hypothetical protein